MSKHLLPLLLAIICSLLCLFVAWLSGFNFDKRGPEAAFCASGTLWVALMSFCIGKLIYYTSNT